MDARVKDVVIECTRASDEERTTFGQVVMKLIEVGIERYHADLARGEKTYYLPDGRSETVPGMILGGTIAEQFSAADVDAALRDIQAGRIRYRTFCRRIAQAGCVGYIVSVVGRRAVYYGRTGDSHVQPFPRMN